ATERRRKAARRGWEQRNARQRAAADDVASSVQQAVRRLQRADARREQPAAPTQLLVPQCCRGNGGRWEEFKASYHGGPFPAPTYMAADRDNNIPNGRPQMKVVFVDMDGGYMPEVYTVAIKTGHSRIRAAVKYAQWKAAEDPDLPDAAKTITDSYAIWLWNKHNKESFLLRPGAERFSDIDTLYRLADFQILYAPQLPVFLREREVFYESATQPLGTFDITNNQAMIKDAVRSAIESARSTVPNLPPTLTADNAVYWLRTAGIQLDNSDDKVGFKIDGQRVLETIPYFYNLGYVVYFAAAYPPDVDWAVPPSQEQIDRTKVNVEWRQRDRKAIIDRQQTPPMPGTFDEEPPAGYGREVPIYFYNPWNRTARPIPPPWPVRGPHENIRNYVMYAVTRTDFPAGDEDAAAGARELNEDTPIFLCNKTFENWFYLPRQGEEFGDVDTKLWATYSLVYGPEYKEGIMVYGMAKPDPHTDAETESDDDSGPGDDQGGGGGAPNPRQWPDPENITFRQYIDMKKEDRDAFRAQLSPQASKEFFGKATPEEKIAYRKRVREEEEQAL
ncbi:MAG: hypothetical protein EB075_12335, partial [Bacteroidetes bacterium]|nr:hypothetical protein [Bacteroidota bacterium]